ncbi:hypothetical protein MNBD_ALPHA09-830 [hydrothermal vent metagenome]|uniref:Major facilitator superfamily (MFS) profile domain-containing protein n=1 Tax=hydrothermal vent metagenome TaxID=652676 RepID=A0A3B0T5H0_9ZZZZ
MKWREAEAKSLAPMRGIAAAIGAVAVFSFTGGITFPLLSFIMERHGATPTLIGLNGAMVPLGIICGALIVPRMARRYGAFRLCLGSFVAVAVLIAGLAMTRDFGLWFPLRFALGVAINFLFVFSETWINQLAPPHIRGRIMGLYVTIAAGGFAFGPILLSVVGSEGYVAFTVAALSPFAALPLLLAARHHLPDSYSDGHGGTFMVFARAAPMLLLLVGIVALYDQTVLTLFPVYGLNSGLGEVRTSWALSVAIAGNMALQLPLGWLADKIDRRAIVVALAVLTASGFAVLPLAIGTFWGWPLLFVIGATGFGGFTIAMVELGDKFSGSMLLTGNSAFAVMWGLGGLVGPPVAGAAMDGFGPQGFPLTLASLFGVLAMAVIWRPLVPASAARSGAGPIA